MIWRHDEYELTDDRRRLDVAAVVALLAQTYWAADRPPRLTRRAIRHSLCLSLFRGPTQVGFCRAVTDYATFTWLCDVVVDPAHRGKGLGKWMVECLLHHPRLQTRSQVLATQDAHSLYERYGFRRAEYLKRRPAEPSALSGDSTQSPLSGAGGPTVGA